MKRSLILFACILFVVSQDVWGALPRTISYQGILTDNNDVIVPDGSYSITFRLYDAASGGTMLWEEAQSVPVTSGRYDAILGNTVSMDPLAFDAKYWLAIKVESDAEMTPRIELSAVGYALSARTVEDDAVTGAKIADGNVVRSINTLPSNTLKDDVWLKGGTNVTITQIADTLLISATGGGGGADGDWSISGSDMYSAVPGNVGVGTASPSARLHVASDNTVLFGADTLGAGSKLMWLPAKSAFRVGGITGTQWDWGNIGDYSTAMGSNTTASGTASAATGYNTTASGAYSTAMGYITAASSDYSTAIGREATASGTISTAMGYGTAASGTISTAMGRNATASGTYSTAMGSNTAPLPPPRVVMQRLNRMYRWPSAGTTLEAAIQLCGSTQIPYLKSASGQTPQIARTL
jgi:hypothetical protein